MKRIFTLLFILAAGFGSMQAQSIQFIDNIADPNVGAVNIYFVWTSTSGGSAGDHAVYDSVIGATFRTASAYSSVIGENWIYTVYLVPGGPDVTSADTASGFKIGTVGPVTTSNYIAIASGVYNTGNYAPNPNGDSIGISLSVLSGALQTSAGADSAKTKLVFFQGATDAGIENLSVTSPASAPIASKIGYGSFGTYATLAPAVYLLSEGDTSGNVLQRYLLPDATAGTATVILGSGFKNPAANNNGAAYGLYTVSANGGAFLPLTTINTGYVQFIHNAPDTALKSLDVYFVETQTGTILEKTTTTFRSLTSAATVYLQVPSTLKIVVAKAGSSSIADSIGTYTIPGLTQDSAYLVIATGVLDTTGLGTSAAFALYGHSGESNGPNGTTLNVFVFHGSPGAPAVNIKTQVAANPNDSIVIPDLTYGQFQGPVVLDSASYLITVTDLLGDVIGVYGASVGYYEGFALGGYSATVYASGYVDTTGGRPAFGLYATLGSNNPTTHPLGGFTVQLPPYVPTGINEVKYVNSIQLAPNPSVATTKLSFNLVNSAKVQLSVIDMLGQEVQFNDLGTRDAGANNVSIDVANFTNGVYLIHMMIDNNSVTRTLVVNK